ncbi:MAG TPA: sugar phosphate nucleotidyltransferase [Patescibacteria group bacterium]|nr:sugar phosphate nucleotidyltransferase [Patescibacteria group bacterium]
MLKSTWDNVGAVILAAGKGTRLNATDKPKVMLPIGGNPIVSYIVTTLEKIGFTPEQICLVVGFQQEKVRDYFGSRVRCALQTEQKGTAHAAFTGMKIFPTKIEEVLVMGGDDSAFYTPGTLQWFIQEHLTNKAVLTLLSAEVENPEQLGRIVRHQDGKIEIIEKEYLTEEQKKIKEISTGTFMLNRKWFEEMFPSMPPLRKLGEYGLPTALAMARDRGLPYQVITLKNSEEWFGVNTPEELAEADSRKRKTVL